MREPFDIARAGGGHSYSGGSHSSSSSSSSHSSSSSSSSHSWSSSSSSSGHSSSKGGGGEGAVFVVAFMFLIFMLIFYAMVRAALGAGAKALKNAAEHGIDWQRKATPTTSFAALQAKDPAFDPDAFRARMTKAFTQIQDAWNAGDLAGVRAFLSDATHERFKVLLAMNQRKGLANRTENLKVDAVSFGDVVSGPVYDNITLKFTASCTDIDADLQGATKRQEFTRFAEHWTFVRRANAATRPQGLVEGNCPACGAVIKLTDKTECVYCHALVASGEFDWILSEITQNDAPAAPFGPQLQEACARVRERDTQFSRQILEDRVSTIFWRQIAAEPSATDVGVGSVDLTGAGKCDGLDDDQLTFTVDWTATDGQHYSKMTLVRAPGVKTELKLGFNSLRCSGCGAPSSKGPKCDHCGAVTDKTKDWVVLDAA